MAFTIYRDLTEHMPVDVAACLANVPNSDRTPCYFVAWGRPADLIWSGLRPYLAGEPDEDGTFGDDENGYVWFASREDADKYVDDMVAAVALRRTNMKG